MGLYSNYFLKFNVNYEKKKAFCCLFSVFILPDQAVGQEVLKVVPFLSSPPKAPRGDTCLTVAATGSSSRNRLLRPVQTGDERKRPWKCRE